MKTNGKYLTISVIECWCPVKFLTIFLVSTSMTFTVKSSIATAIKELQTQRKEECNLHL